MILFYKGKMSIRRTIHLVLMKDVHDKKLTDFTSPFNDNRKFLDDIIRYEISNICTFSI